MDRPIALSARTHRPADAQISLRAGPLDEVRQLVQVGDGTHPGFTGLDVN
jgi:hypothetical protein